MSSRPQAEGSNIEHVPLGSRVLFMVVVIENKQLKNGAYLGAIRNYG
jgi:hypothetical protein